MSPWVVVRMTPEAVELFGAEVEEEVGWEEVAAAAGGVE